MENTDEDQAVVSHSQLTLIFTSFLLDVIKNQPSSQFHEKRVHACLLLFQILAGNHDPKTPDLTMTNNKAFPPIMETISISTQAGKTTEASEAVFV